MKAWAFVDTSTDGPLRLGVSLEPENANETTLLRAFVAQGLACRLVHDPSSPEVGVLTGIPDDNRSCNQRGYHRAALDDNVCLHCGAVLR